MLDPFEVENGWFVLELVDFQVLPNPDPDVTDASLRMQIQRTIDWLGLDDHEHRTVRREYAEAYWKGDITLAYLRRRAPFVAMELERQGRLTPSES